MPTATPMPVPVLGKTGPAGESCRTCYFYEPSDTLGEPGTCHRYPMRGYPILQPQNVRVVSVAGMPGGEYWCGEYKRKTRA